MCSAFSSRWSSIYIYWKREGFGNVERTSRSLLVHISFAGNELVSETFQSSICFYELSVRYSARLVRTSYSFSLNDSTRRITCSWSLLLVCTQFALATRQANATGNTPTNWRQQRFGISERYKFKPIFLYLRFVGETRDNADSFPTCLPSRQITFRASTAWWWILVQMQQLVKRAFIRRSVIWRWRMTRHTMISTTFAWSGPGASASSSFIFLFYMFVWWWNEEEK